MTEKYETASGTCFAQVRRMGVTQSEYEYEFLTHIEATIEDTPAGPVTFEIEIKTQGTNGAPWCYIPINGCFRMLQQLIYDAQERGLAEPPGARIEWPTAPPEPRSPAALRDRDDEIKH